MDSKKIQTLISGYGLMDTLLERLQVVVVDGVARSTVYAAFATGPTTARKEIILRTAEEVIREHEASVASLALAM